MHSAAPAAPGVLPPGSRNPSTFDATPWTIPSLTARQKFAPSISFGDRNEWFLIGVFGNIVLVVEFEGWAWGPPSQEPSSQ